jgi:Mn2+/Fe2+ NRAMP family transporter
LPGFWKRILIFLTIFGPATITAMADNDAGGVATYSMAGAKLGYPILFPLVIITILLGVTQEMGMRLTVITRKGLADLIREKFGVKVAIFMFGALLIANIGTLITEIAAIKTTSTMLHIPPIPFVMVIVVWCRFSSSRKAITNLPRLSCWLPACSISFISSRRSKPILIGGWRSPTCFIRTVWI